MVDIDTRFPLLWPFGILKTTQWAASLALLITLYSSQYHWAGTELVFFTAWTAFLVTFLSWLAHLFGFNRKTMQMGNAFCFVPFALVDFVYSTILFLFYLLSILFCFIGFFRGISYEANIAVAYFFASIFCIIAGSACGYLAWLLFRAAPNGRILNLRSVVIGGSGTELFEATTTNDATSTQPA